MDDTHYKIHQRLDDAHYKIDKYLLCKYVLCHVKYTNCIFYLSDLWFT